MCRLTSFRLEEMQPSSAAMANPCLRSLLSPGTFGLETTGLFHGPCRQFLFVIQGQFEGDSQAATTPAQLSALSRK